MNHAAVVERLVASKKRSEEHVERLHAENPEGSVVIIADKTSETGTLVEVMDQVRLAGVFNVSIAADQSGGG